MIASDVMTRGVISIRPDATVEEAARVMLSRNISGLLVVDEKGDLVGIVTEGDLLRRDEIGTEHERSWWLRILVSPSRQAADFVRAHGRHVRDVMTENVLSVPHDAPLESVVALMEKRRIKRVPVTQDNRVVGIVSRADLLRALLGRISAAAPAEVDDNALRTAIMNELNAQPWAPRTSVNVTVSGGVADINGSVTSEAERNAIRVVVENTPGIKAVHDHLVFIEPYTGTVIEAPSH